MDNIRFVLLCALGALAFFLYQAWQADYPTQPTETRQQTSASTGSNGDVPDIGSAPGQKSEHAEAATPGQKTQKQDNELRHGQSVHVVTDKLDVTIDTHGGILRRVALRGVPVSESQPDTALKLINDSLPNFFIVQSGLSGDDAPNHNSTFHVSKQSWRLADGQSVLRVPLTWTDGNGHKVTKTYVFHRNSYRVDLEHEIDNTASTDWAVSQYVRMWRTPHQVPGGMPFHSPFIGVGWYEAVPGKSGSFRYEDRAGDKLADDPVSDTQEGGWLAMVQHYFVGAVIPPEGVKVRYFAKSRPVPGSNQGFAAGFISASKTVASGQQADMSTTMFLGPKLQDQMNAVAPGLDLTVNYGWFTIIAQPIFWVLNKLHSVAGNWGVAILLLTLLIQAIFYKLSEKQYRAMARMRKFAPRMKQLKEQYGDDKQQLQSKMMELYKKEGFNPLAGCWPMLVQMPVFVAMYWCLRGAAELRLAPFLWLPDLTAPDPYYILPVLFGVLMFLQQRLQTNVTMDPMQQRMMQIMPLGMAVFFAFFPSGLVLYYCFRSLILIAQQWYIYRKLDAEGLGHKASAK